MEIRKPNILILSYYFPPCKKVGGRRWGKFAKYLTRRGYNVHAIKIDLPYEGVCPWEEDVLSFRNNVIKIPYINNKPYYRRVMNPSNIVGKIRYRLSFSVQRVKKAFYKGNFEDVSRLYEDQLISTAKEKIKVANINTVIVTGGPFSWVYFALKLKSEFPHIKFIVDFRDYWCHGEEEKFWTKSVIKIEAEKEKMVFKNADLITTPAERIINDYKRIYPQYANKLVLLSHGFDEDEVNVDVTKLNSDVLQLIYGGILYEKMDLAINQLVQFLLELKKIDRKFKLKIYSFDRKYYDLFIRASVEDSIEYLDPVPAVEFFEECKRSDFLLQLRAGGVNEEHFKSTKFYELLALDRFILYFGPRGDISDFIETNRRGNSIFNGLPNLVQFVIDAKEGKIFINEDKIVNDYSFSRLTDKLVELL